MKFNVFQTNTQEKQEPGSGIVPKGAKTRDFYRTNNIPERFDNPGMKKSLFGLPWES